MSASSGARARWEAGEAPLAHIHIAQSGLPRHVTSAQAFRLFLAETMLDAGLPPAAVRKAFRGGLARYSEDEPRVPAGHHRESGRWTTGAITVAGGEKDDHHTDRMKDKDPADEGRRALGAETPEEALSHGRPIESGLAGMPFPSKTLQEADYTMIMQLIGC